MTNNDFPLEVIFEEDGSVTFDWDGNHPLTSQFNTWTKTDFLMAITAGLEDELLMLLEEQCVEN